MRKIISVCVTSRNSSVGTAPSYRTQGPVSDIWRDRDIFSSRKSTRRTMDAFQPPIQWAPSKGFFWRVGGGVKRPERVFDVYSPSGAKVKNEWSYRLTFSHRKCLHSVYRATFTSNFLSRKWCGNNRLWTWFKALNEMCLEGIIQENKQSVRKVRSPAGIQTAYLLNTSWKLTISV
jgi:hypothetical protein